MCETSMEWLQDVLAVARAVFLAAEQLDELGVQTVDAGLKRGALALDLDGVRRPRGGPCSTMSSMRVGMDAAVGDELFERQARDLAAHGIERRRR